MPPNYTAVTYIPYTFPVLYSFLLALLLIFRDFAIAARHRSRRPYGKDERECYEMLL